MNEISAIGGLMILAIGLNVMKLTKIRVSQLFTGDFGSDCYHDRSILLLIH